MSPEELRLTAFIGGLFLWLIVESFRPARSWKDSRSQRIGFHLFIAVINTVLMRVFVTMPFGLWAALVRANGWGISPWLGLTGAPEIILAIIACDFLDWQWHWMNHRVPFFWRFHKVHHVDTHVDVTTSLRFHPGEFLFSAGMKCFWIFIWGPSLWAFAIFETAISAAAQFHHSNISLPEGLDRWARFIVVTPRYHAAHHTVTERSREANFCTIFIWWDRIFGTYREPDSEELKRLGLPRGRETYLQLGATMAGPFTGAY